MIEPTLEIGVVPEGHTAVDFVHSEDGWHVEIEGKQYGVVFDDLGNAQGWLDMLVSNGAAKPPLVVTYVDVRPWRNES